VRRARGPRAALARWQGIPVTRRSHRRPEALAVSDRAVIDATRRRRPASVRPRKLFARQPATPLWLRPNQSPQPSPLPRGRAACRPFELAACPRGSTGGSFRDCGPLCERLQALSTSSYTTTSRHRDDSPAPQLPCCGARAGTPNGGLIAPVESRKMFRCIRAPPCRTDSTRPTRLAYRVPRCGRVLAQPSRGRRPAMEVVRA
jgi:hypothetical protein